MQSNSLKCSRNNEASAKAKWRWTETCSRSHSHLSLFARCFTNWPTVPNPRFSEIALAEGITTKNDQCQLTSVTEEFFPGSWGSDDRSWKTKKSQRGGSTGHSDTQARRNIWQFKWRSLLPKAGEKLNKDFFFFLVQMMHFREQASTLALEKMRAENQGDS